MYSQCMYSFLYPSKILGNPSKLIVSWKVETHKKIWETPHNEEETPQELGFDGFPFFDRNRGNT